MLSSYAVVIRRLLVFSILMDKLKEMSSAIKELDNTRVFNLTELGCFDIFDSYRISKDKYQETPTSGATTPLITPGTTPLLKTAGVYYSS